MPPSLTPKTAADASNGNFLRLLLLGDPKSWKTSIVARGPGPVYFIKSDRGNSLRPALEFAKDFLFSEAFTRNEMEIALKLARAAAEKGEIKTVCWDTITGFSDPLAEECLAKESYAPAAWNSYHMYLSNVCNRLVEFPCHVVVNAHYMDLTSASEDAQAKEAKAAVPRVWKPGKDAIVPLLNGASRKRIPAIFDDIVFIDRLPDGKRVFVCSADGVSGPGGRNLKGVTTCEPDINILLKKMEESNAG